MNSFFIYQAEVAISLAMLYFLYYLFLRKLTFFTLNRIVLLLIPVIALLVPLLNLLSQVTGMLKPLHLNNIAVYATSVLAPVKAQTSNPGHLLSYLFLIYLAGVCLFCGLFFTNLFKIISLIRKNKMVRVNGIKIILIPKEMAPFSFLNYSFISDSIYHSDKFEQILRHENFHIIQRHTLDILFFELLKIFQWFNPVVYWLKNSAHETHEYIVDDQMTVNQKKSHYARLLLDQIYGVSQLKSVHTFNSSQIKNRLLMLNRHKSNKISTIRYLLIIPAVLAILSMHSCSSQKSLLKKKTPIQTEKKVDIYPQFPGGNGTMFSFLSTHIVYPKKAKRKKIEGKVIVGFIIDKNGKIQNITVKRSDNKLLNKAAMAAIKQMPDWQPAQKDGKPVNYQVFLPIQFKLKKNGSK